MKEYFLQAGKPQEFSDIPGIQDEKQTIVDEGQINESFEPANDAFDGLRELGDWIIQTVSELFGSIFGNIM